MIRRNSTAKTIFAVLLVAIAIALTVSIKESNMIAPAFGGSDSMASLPEVNSQIDIYKNEWELKATWADAGFDRYMVYFYENDESTAFSMKLTADPSATAIFRPKTESVLAKIYGLSDKTLTFLAETRQKTKDDVKLEAFTSPNNKHLGLIRVTTDAPITVDVIIDNDAKSLCCGSGVNSFTVPLPDGYESAMLRYEHIYCSFIEYDEDIQIDIDYDGTFMRRNGEEVVSVSTDTYLLKGSTNAKTLLVDGVSVPITNERFSVSIPIDKGLTSIIITATDWAEKSTAKEIVVYYGSQEKSNTSFFIVIIIILLMAVISFLILNSPNKDKDKDKDKDRKA